MSDVSTQSAEAAQQSQDANPIDSTGRERRRYERHLYQFPQLLAPFRGDSPPKMNELREVQCVDLSAGGLSFFWPTQPDFEFAIVGLGKRPQLIFMKLQILRTIPSPNRDGILLVAGRFRGHHKW